MRAGQKLRREIRDATRIGAAIFFDAPDGVGEKSVAHGEREREINIVFCRHDLEPAEPARRLSRKACLISSTSRPVRVLLDEFIKRSTVGLGFGNRLACLGGAHYSTRLSHLGSHAVRTMENTNRARAKANARARTRRCSNVFAAWAKKSILAKGTVFARY